MCIAMSKNLISISILHLVSTTTRYSILITDRPAMVLSPVNLKQKLQPTALTFNTAINREIFRANYNTYLNSMLYGQNKFFIKY